MSEPERANLVWRKSTESAGGPDCVEVAISSEMVFVRNSLHSDGPVVGFLHNEWAAFLLGVRNDEFELPSPPVVTQGG